MCKLVGAQAEVKDAPQGFNWFLLTCTEGAPVEICATANRAPESSATAFVEVFPGQDHEERWGAAVLSANDATSPHTAEALRLTLLAGEESAPKHLELEWEVDSLEILSADQVADLRSMMSQRPMLLDPADSEDHGIPLEAVAEEAPLAGLRDMLREAALDARWVTFEGWQQPTGAGDRLHATYTVAPSGTGVVVAPVGVEEEEGEGKEGEEVRALVGLYADSELLTVASSDGEVRYFEVVTVRNAHVVDAQQAPEIF